MCRIPIISAGKHIFDSEVTNCSLIPYMVTFYVSTNTYGSFLYFPIGPLYAVDITVSTPEYLNQSNIDNFNTDDFPRYGQLF